MSKGGEDFDLYPTATGLESVKSVYLNTRNRKGEKKKKRRSMTRARQLSIINSACHPNSLL